MDAVTASLKVGTRHKAGKRSRKNGKFLRDGAVIERERRALELLCAGATHSDIGRALEISRSAASNLISRALSHRAEREGPAVEQARTLHTMRLENLLARWYPRATGDWMDPETGESSHEPDYRAADMTLKILSQLADIQGTKKIIPVRPEASPDAPLSGGDLPGHFHHPAERQRAEEGSLASLTKAREKQHTIEGQLATIGTTQAQLIGTEVNDTPGPPPIRT